MADEVMLQPSDPFWPAMFAAEKARLQAALGSRFVAIEHFGSTAVPGLDAKPVIDLLGGVRSMSEADDLLAPLCELGWDTSPEFNATLSDRRFLLRWSNGIRTHHLHLVVHGSNTWLQRLKFRDLLCLNPELAGKYQALKHELAARYHHDREMYTSAKAEFVARAIGSV